MEYEIDMESMISEIEEKDPDRICIQLPDGLKPKARDILDTLERRFPDKIFVLWGGSNYGACDIPAGLERLKIDLLLHVGHTEFRTS